MTARLVLTFGNFLLFAWFFSPAFGWLTAGANYLLEEQQRKERRAAASQQAIADWKEEYSIDLNDPVQAASDFDNDQVTAAKEFANGTSPVGNWLIEEIPYLEGRTLNQLIDINSRGEILAFTSGRAGGTYLYHQGDNANWQWTQVTTTRPGFYSLTASGLTDEGLVYGRQGDRNSIRAFFWTAQDGDSTLPADHPYAETEFYPTDYNDRGDGLFKLRNNEMRTPVIDNQVISGPRFVGIGWSGINSFSELAGTADTWGGYSSQSILYSHGHLFATGLWDDAGNDQIDENSNTFPQYFQRLAHFNSFGEFVSSYNTYDQKARNQELAAFFYDGVTHTPPDRQFSEPLGLTDDRTVLLRTKRYSSNQHAPIYNDELWSDPLVIPVNKVTGVPERYDLSQPQIAANGVIVARATLTDGQPGLIRISPDNDRDGDGLPDDWETANGLNPQDSSDALLDTDGDGQINLAEFRLRQNPQIVDESQTLADNPTQEGNIRAGIDSDGDGMPNVWEWDNALDPFDPSDADEDPDRDGYTNLEEYKLGTTPHGAPVYTVLELDQLGLESVATIGRLSKQGLLHLKPTNDQRNPGHLYNTSSEELIALQVPEHQQDSTNKVRILEVGTRSVIGLIERAPRTYNLVLWDSSTGLVTRVSDRPFSTNGSKVEISATGDWVINLRESRTAPLRPWKFGQNGSEELALPDGVTLSGDIYALGLKVYTHAHKSSHYRLLSWNLADARPSVMESLYSSNDSYPALKGVISHNGEDQVIVQSSGQLRLFAPSLRRFSYLHTGTIGATNRRIRKVEGRSLILDVTQQDGQRSTHRPGIFQIDRDAGDNFTFIEPSGEGAAVSVVDLSRSGEVLGYDTLEGNEIRPWIKRGTSRHDLLESLRTSNPVEFINVDTLADNGTITGIGYRTSTSERFVLVLSADTDGDGLSDTYEQSYGLDPFARKSEDSDTDGDGLSDLEELRFGTDPTLVDSDSDKVPDGWEVEWGLDATSAENKFLDPDGDKLPNYLEFQNNSNPTGYYVLDENEDLGSNVVQVVNTNQNLSSLVQKRNQAGNYDWLVVTPQGGGWNQRKIETGDLGDVTSVSFTRLVRNGLVTGRAYDRQLRRWICLLNDGRTTRRLPDDFIEADLSEDGSILAALTSDRRLVIIQTQDRYPPNWAIDNALDRATESYPFLNDIVVCNEGRVFGVHSDYTDALNYYGTHKVGEFGIEVGREFFREIEHKASSTLPFVYLKDCRTSDGLVDLTVSTYQPDYTLADQLLNEYPSVVKRRAPLPGATTWSSIADDQSSTGRANGVAFFTDRHGSRIFEKLLTPDGELVKSQLTSEESVEVNQFTTRGAVASCGPRNAIKLFRFQPDNDADGDGYADDWRNYWYSQAPAGTLNTLAAAGDTTTDTDQDGASDYEESQRGTSPWADHSFSPEISDSDISESNLANRIQQEADDGIEEDNFPSSKTGNVFMTTEKRRAGANYNFSTELSDDDDLNSTYFTINGGNGYYGDQRKGVEGTSTDEFSLTRLHSELQAVPHSFASTAENFDRLPFLNLAFPAPHSWLTDQIYPPNPQSHLHPSSRITAHVESWNEVDEFEVEENDGEITRRHQATYRYAEIGIAETRTWLRHREPELLERRRTFLFVEEDFTYGTPVDASRKERWDVGGRSAPIVTGRNVSSRTLTVRSEELESEPLDVLVEGSHLDKRHGAIQTRVHDLEIESRDRMISGRLSEFARIDPVHGVTLTFKDPSSRLIGTPIVLDGRGQLRSEHSSYFGIQNLFSEEEMVEYDEGRLESLAIDQEVVITTSQISGGYADTWFTTIADNLGDFTIEVRSRGQYLGSVTHELTEDEEFARLIAAAEGLIAGDDPPEIEAWPEFPTFEHYDGLPDENEDFTEDELAEVMAGAPPAAQTNLSGLGGAGTLIDPVAMLLFIHEVREETGGEGVVWHQFINRLNQLDYGTDRALSPAADAAVNDFLTGQRSWQNTAPQTVKTDIELPAQIRNRGLVARALIYWIKRLVKTHVAVGEGLIFGVWDGIKGEVEGVVDTLKMAGQLPAMIDKFLNDPYRAASELYHSFKAIADLGWPGVKKAVQQMVGAFVDKNQARLGLLLGEDAKDSKYLAAYFVGYTTGYIGEQVAVMVFTGGIAAGTKVGLIGKTLREGRRAATAMIAESKKLSPRGDRLQKASKSVGVEFGRVARSADDIRGARRNGSKCASNNGCLAKGTLIRMADLSTKPVESLRCGDWVLSADPNFPHMRFPVRVEAQFDTGLNSVFELRWTTKGSGLEHTDSVLLTGEHPLWIVESGWTPASKVKKEDRLFGRDLSAPIVMESIARGFRKHTYNIDVGGVDSFFVAGKAHDILVHNEEYDLRLYGQSADIEPGRERPYEKHHGIMNIWLENHFPATYRNRESERTFPCIELSHENHKLASAVEANFRRTAPKIPGRQAVDWSKVSVQDALKVSTEAFRAAGVSEERIREQRRLMNSWLRANLGKLRC